MSYIICNARMPLTSLRPLIVACRFPAKALVLLESLPQHTVTRQKERLDLLWFSRFDLEKLDREKIKFESYSSGRVFHESGELRWEREQDWLQMVYIGDESEFSKGVEETLLYYRTDKDTPPPKLPSLYSQRKTYYLFGTRLEAGDLKEIGPFAQEGDFAEVRIHRLLRYPLKTSNVGPIRLVVDELIDETTQQRLYFRFVGLDEEPEKEERPA